MADSRATDVASSSAMEEFEAFYERWIVEQQRFLDQLIRLLNQDDVRKQEEAIEEVMLHYVWYYEEKAKAMARHKLCFLNIHLCPPWLSSLEKVVFWMGGFKPSFALSLLEASVADMLPEQRQRVEAVRAEVEEDERAMEEVVERGHEAIMAGRGGGYGVDDGDTAVVEELRRAMREAMRWADRLRRETVKKAVSSLSGPQTVKFLVAVGSYHLGLRSLGLNHPLL